MNEYSLNPENYKSYFSWEKFSKLKGREREDLIRFTVEQIRHERGLKNVNVEFFKSDSTSRGSCSQTFEGKHFTGHTLKLNEDILTEADDYYAPYKTFKTINHELEHAYQYELTSNRKVKNSDPVALELRLNDQHYYNASGDKLVIWQGNKGRIPRFDEEIDSQMYRAQACESDARATGLAAVEGLKTDGQNDLYLDSYLRTQKAREINKNKIMISKLGMHSREEMANEELQYISTRKLKEPDRKRMLEYARQKDFEIAREVLNADSRGTEPEEELRNRFENDQGYTNFYKTHYYNQNKVNESNHDFYIYAKYKWEETGGDDITSASEPKPPVISTEGKDSLGISQSAKGAAFGAISAVAAQNIFNAYDYGYKTLWGYNVTQGMKGGIKLASAIARMPGGNPMLEDSAEILGRAFDIRYASMHPDEVINFIPSPVSQDIIDKHTLVISDQSNPYSSAVMINEEGNAAFFEEIDGLSERINTEANQEFFEEQDTYPVMINEEGNAAFFEELGQKFDEKLENAKQTNATITRGQKR